MHPAPTAARWRLGRLLNLCKTAGTGVSGGGRPRRASGVTRIATACGTADGGGAALRLAPSARYLKNHPESSRLPFHLQAVRRSWRRGHRRPRSRPSRPAHVVGKQPAWNSIQQRFATQLVDPPRRPVRPGLAGDHRATRAKIAIDGQGRIQLTTALSSPAADDAPAADLDRFNEASSRGRMTPFADPRIVERHPRRSRGLLHCGGDPSVRCFNIDLDAEALATVVITTDCQTGAELLFAASPTPPPPPPASPHGADRQDL